MLKVSLNYPNLQFSEVFENISIPQNVHWKTSLSVKISVEEDHHRVHELNHKI
jgi:hypothetical protein